MLPRIFRLSTDYEFRRVKRLGRGVTTPYFGVYFAENRRSPVTKFGIIITNNLDKRAVCRNRIKRLLRRSIEAHLTKYKPGYDVVLVAFKKALTATYEEISNTFNQALSKTPLLWSRYASPLISWSPVLPVFSLLFTVLLGSSGEIWYSQGRTYGIYTGSKMQPFE